MKILFLDIDGVLVNRQSFHDRKWKHANAHPDCVAALYRILAATGASSTWRIGQKLVDLREIINLRFGVEGPVIDKPPRLLTETRHAGKPGQIVLAAERGDEIGKWLETHERHPIESYVILDDDSDMGKHKHRLVQTKFDEGLTMAHAERAIALLSGGAK